MCQFCVDRGAMSQEDLDQRLASGDTKVTPLYLLEDDELVDVVADIVTTAIADGLRQQLAMDMGVALINRVRRVRDQMRSEQ